jgi:processive 1,2-diacylglycerol beta-glucosyltransferase
VAPDIYDLAWRRKTDYDAYQWINDVGLLQDFLLERLNRHGASIVVATHVLPCILAVGLKKRSLVKNVYGVITDFGAHSLWPIEGVDRYFVATDELKNTLTFRGIKSSIIHATGIPIKKIYPESVVKPVSPKIRILIVSGGLRGAGYKNLRNFFIDLLDNIISMKFENCELTIVTGNQKQLKKELIIIQQNSKVNFRVLGFVHDIPRLMMANDILITKSGGLIISEALAIGICIILSQSGPGQESANIDFLARQGAAFKGDTPEEVAQVLNFLIENPNLISEMKMKTKALGHPESAVTIARIITDDLN